MGQIKLSGPRNDIVVEFSDTTSIYLDETILNLRIPEAFEWYTASSLELTMTFGQPALTSIYELSSSDLGIGLTFGRPVLTEISQYDISTADLTLVFSTSPVTWTQGHELSSQNSSMDFLVQNPALTFVAATPVMGINIERAPSQAQYAPEGIWFYAIPVGFSNDAPPANSIIYDPDFHEVEYLWDFGDPGDVFTATENTLPEYKDANSAIGKNAVHVFRNPGTYTVTCTARRVTNYLTMAKEEVVASVTVTVQDDATLWTAANTIVVAHDGDFTGAPASDWQCTEWLPYDNDSLFWANNPVHWAGVLWELMTWNSPVRVLFKCGGDYSGHAVGFSHANLWRPYEFIHFGSWGTGAKPISSECRAFAHNGLPVVWKNIHFKEDYDDLTETGHDGFVFSSRSCGYQLLTECEVSGGRGGGVGMSILGNDTPSNLIIHDTKMYSLGKYGVYHYARPKNYDGLGSTDRLAVIGVMDIDSGAAPNGLGGVAGNEQGPIRTGAEHDVVISNCDFFCRFGWTGQSAWPADGMAATAVQAIIRIAGAAPTTGNQRNGDVIIARNSAEGNGLISVSGPIDKAPFLGNILYDSNMFMGIASTESFGNTEVGAITIRNNLFIKPAVPDSYSMGNIIALGQVTRDVGVMFDEVARSAEPLRIFGNSFILKDASTLNNGVFMSENQWTNPVLTNNLLYIENNQAYATQEDFAPFETDDAPLWTPRYLGRLEEGDLGVLQTQYATPANQVSLYGPLDGSGVLASVSAGPIPLYDMLGRVRPAGAARGALEEVAPIGVTLPGGLASGTSFGFSLDMSTADQLSQDTAGSTPVTANGQLVGRFTDGIFDTNHGTSVASLFGVWNGVDGRVDFDNSQKNFTINVPSTTTGEIYAATTKGRFHFKSSYPASATRKIIRDVGFAGINMGIYGIVYVDRAFTTDELTALEDKYSVLPGVGPWMNDATELRDTWLYSYLTGFVPGTTFAAATNVRGMFFGCSITDVGTELDFTNVNNAKAVFLDCDFTSIAGNFQFPNLVHGSEMFQNTPLVTVPSDIFSTTNCTDFWQAFANTNLSQTSIDTILVNLAARGTSNGVFDQSGGTAPSATGEAAVDTLRGRGWDVDVTGGY